MSEQALIAGIIEATNSWKGTAPAYVKEVWISFDGNDFEQDLGGADVQKLVLVGTSSNCNARVGGHHRPILALFAAV